MTMDDRGRFLQELGLDPFKKPSTEEVKKAWKKKCQEHHPDKFQDPKEQEEHRQKFLEITHAYRMLTDPSYRAEESRKTSGPVLDLHIRMNLPISFENAFFGVEMGISFNRIEIDKTGKPIIKEEQIVEYITCVVPPGCMEGFEKTIAGKGIIQGDNTGNLILMFHPVQHPKFKVIGNNICCDENVPLLLLLKGGPFEVQTMFGICQIVIPAGTKPGEQFRISSHGVNSGGDHVVRVLPIFPERKELKEESWKGLDINWEIEKDEEEISLNALFEEARKKGWVKITEGAL
jgi:curved DNA-binding protein